MITTARSPKGRLRHDDASLLEGVRSATRTLVLLKYLARKSEPATAAELVRECGIPKSSLYQLLNVMRARRFVTYYPALRAWGLGLATFEVGSAALSEQPLERLGDPILQTLAASTGEAANLAVRRGSEVENLLTTAAPKMHSIHLVSRVGIRLPAHLTAVGRAILMHLSRDELETIFRPEQTLPTRTPHAGPVDLVALAEQLARAREAGYAVEDQLTTPGVTSIAAPVFDYSGHVIAGVGLSFLAAAYPSHARADMVSAICDAGRTLSARLGWTGVGTLS